MFSMPNEDGSSSDDFQQILYYLNENGFDIIMTVMAFQGNMTSAKTITFKFTENEVKLYESISTSSIAGMKTKKYNPPHTIFKIPSPGKQALFSYQDITGDVYKCTSSWTIVTIDNIEKKAINVVKRVEGFEDVGDTMEYYVEGIGLWKIDFVESNGKVMTQSKLDALENVNSGY